MRFPISCVLVLWISFVSCSEQKETSKDGIKGRNKRDIGKPSIQISRRNIIDDSQNGTALVTIGDRFSGVKGKRIEISCPFYGDPYPRAVWFFRGRVIDHIKFSNLDITEPNGVSVLSVIKLNRYHVGEYTCMVFNRHGRVFAKAYIRQIVPGQPTIFSQRYSKTLSVNEKTVNVSIGTNVTAFQGSSIVLWCDVRSPYNRTFEIKWASPSTSNKMNQFVRKTSVLELSHLTERDNGYYYCNVDDKNGAADQQRSTITIIRKVPPTIQTRNDTLKYIRGSGEAPVMIGDTVVVRAGFNVKIACQFNANPVGKISWLKKGMELALPSANLVLDKKRNILIIKNIAIQHSDVYSCMIENVLGKKVASSNITVIPKKSAQPRIEDGDHRKIINIVSTKGITLARIGETVRIIQGAALRLRCDASGVPTPDIEWTLNREPIKDDSTIQSGNELLILNFQAKHKGDYKCVARNIIGQARAWSDVRIIVSVPPKIKFSSSYYKIADQSSLVKLVIGDTLKTSGGRDIEIKCPIEGHPVPNPMWKHVDKMLEASKNVVIDSKRKTLLLKDVDEWKSGVYSCFAMNGAGVAVSSTTLQILPKGTPVITSKEKVERVLEPEKKFVDIDIGTNLTTTTQKNLRIVCPSAGFDNANIEWTINDKSLRYDTRILLSNGNELIINDLQFFDSGVYKCRVYSQYGFDIMATKLQIIGSLSDQAKNGDTQTNQIQYTGKTGNVKATSGKDITVISGQNLEIHCPTRGTLRPTLTWFKDSVKIQPSNRMIPRGEMLVLNEVSLDMEGLYTCRMTTEIGTKTTDTNLKVLEFKRVNIKKGSGQVKATDFKKELRVNIGTDIYTIPGLTVKIQCPYIALPKAEILWYFNSDKIVDDKRFNQDKLTDALIIPKVTFADTGTYTCHAVQGDRIEEASSQVRLLAMHPSKIDQSERQVYSNPAHSDIIYMRVGDSIVANLDKRIQIDCHATGLPEPKFIWKFNGKSLTKSKHTVDFRNGSILVQRVTWEHEGRFECFAINSLGVDSVSTEVKVVGAYVPTDFVPVKKSLQVLKLTQETTSVAIGTTLTLRSGNNLIIKCPVNIFGQVNTIWEKDGDEFTGTRMHADGSVFIKKIMPSDAGEYICYSNDEAKIEFGKIVLKVIAPIHDLLANNKSEEVEFYLPQRHVLNVKMGGKVSILRGNLVRFVCPIVEKANVDIKWYINMAQVFDGDQYIVEGRTLQLKDSSDIGTYNVTCEISGAIGSTSVRSELVVVAPTNINVKAINQNIVSTKSFTKVDVGGKVFVLDGSSVDIKCPVSSIPPPKIIWKRNGRRVYDGSGQYMKQQGFILSIPSIRKQTAGKYICIASNEFGGEVEASMKLGVYVAKSPVIIPLVSYKLGKKNNKRDSKRQQESRQLENKKDEKFKFIATDDEEHSDYIGRDYNVLSGPNFNLLCNAEGQPKPTVKWEIDGNKISASSNSYLIQTRDLNEAGNYTCIATNAFGTASKSSFVTILAPSKPVIQRDVGYMNKTGFMSEAIETFPKVELMIGDNLETLTDTNIIIRCPAIGIPAPKVSFFKGGKLLKKSDVVLMDGSGSLILKPASKNFSSEGVYTCHAENSDGFQEMNTTITLYNAAKPVFLRPVTKPQYSYDSATKEGQLYLTVGQNTRAYPNTIVVIKCPVSGFPFPHVMWEKDGKPIKTEGVVVMKDNSTTLTYKFTDKKGAVFTCIAVNVAGKSRLNSIINLAEPLPARILSPQSGVITARETETNITVGQNVNMMSGATLRIMCPSLGEPKPTVTWIHVYKKKGSLERNPAVKFSSSGLEITLSKITRELSGTFKCVATNAFGSDEKRTFVKVKVSSAPRIRTNKKKIVSKPRTRQLKVTIGGELYVHQHTKVILECPVYGFPPPEVKWFKDNKPFEKSGNHAFTSRELTLDNIQITNEGVYKCTATNFLNTVQAESKVFVGFAPTIEEVERGLSPIISSTANSEVKIPIGVQDTYIRLGSTAVFQCKAKGHPTPKYIWKFNNRVMDVENKTKYESLVPSVLEVKNLSISDRGSYSCEVQNMYGKMRRTSRLFMMEPPFIQSTRSNISITTWSREKVYTSVGGALTIVRGMSVVIRCPSIGIPDPRIRWRKLNTTYMWNKRIYLTYKFELAITDARTADSGIYVCKAENRLGRASGSFHLIVAEKPRAVVYPDYRMTEEGRTKLASIGRRQLVIAKGQLIRLMCHIRGSPTPKVTWLKDHDIIRLTSRHTINGQYLTIKSAREEDMGKYVCIAENVMGATTGLTEISLGAKPVIDKSTPRNSSGNIIEVNIGTSKNVKIGATVKIYCKVQGLPLPSITWIVVKERNSRKTISRLRSDEYDVLTLRDMTRDEQGVYSCQVKNSIGSDTASTNLTLSDASFITSQVNLGSRGRERMFKFNETNEAHVIEDEAVRLVCAGAGYPTPSVSFVWRPKSLSEYKDFIDQLSPFGRNEIMKTLNAEPLKIPDKPKDANVSDNFREITNLLRVRLKGATRYIQMGQLFSQRILVQSTGLYVCRTSNALGSDEKSMNVYVHPKPTRSYAGVWVALPYGNCSVPCSRSNFGVQTRDVYCLGYGGRKISDRYCRTSDKPVSTKECPSTDCITEWGSSKWSECSRTCGEGGYQFRTPYCMYSKSKVKVQSNNCPRETEPATRRRCNAYPCSQWQCVDRYRHCQLIKRMEFCHAETYKTFCCKSCVREKGAWGPYQE